jgi:hypothetical protein
MAITSPLQLSCVALPVVFLLFPPIQLRMGILLSHRTVELHVEGPGDCRYSICFDEIKNSSSVRQVEYLRRFQSSPCGFAEGVGELAHEYS